MKHPWLTFLTIGFLSAVVILFFWVSQRPIQVQEPVETITPGSITEPIITFLNPQLGGANAKVTIVEYGDFECDACKDFSKSIERVLERYGADVRFVWKHMPNDSVHPQATPAAIASQCAHEQGRFWEYHDVLFERQALLSESIYPQIASELEMNVDAFENCFFAQETRPIVQKDFDEGRGLGITATPTIFINSERITGAPSFNELIRYVEEQIGDN